MAHNEALKAMEKERNQSKDKLKETIVIMSDAMEILQSQTGAPIILLNSCQSLIVERLKILSIGFEDIGLSKSIANTFKIVKHQALNNKSTSL